MIRWMLIILIKTYQSTISPFLRPACRFYPSCSNYAVGCIVRHGPAKGIWLGGKRLLRCHPFNLGGYDPVP